MSPQQELDLLANTLIDTSSPTLVPNFASGGGRRVRAKFAEGFSRERC